jgi:Zn-dependent metalloprotease
VPNKAAYLISEGGSFNSYQVTGIGIWKMNYIMFDVLMNATSTMTFAEFGAQTLNSCQTLASTGAGGISTTDCANSVLPALQATGLY